MSSSPQADGQSGGHGAIVSNWMGNGQPQTGNATNTGVHIASVVVDVPSQRQQEAPDAVIANSQPTVAVAAATPAGTAQTAHDPIVLQPVAAVSGLVTASGASPCDQIPVQQVPAAVAQTAATPMGSPLQEAIAHVQARTVPEDAADHQVKRRRLSQSSPQASQPQQVILLHPDVPILVPDATAQQLDDIANFQIQSASARSVQPVNFPLVLVNIQVVTLSPAVGGTPEVEIYPALLKPPEQHATVKAEPGAAAAPADAVAASKLGQPVAGAAGWRVEGLAAVTQRLQGWSVQGWTNVDGRTLRLILAPPPHLVVVPPTGNVPGYAAGASTAGQVLHNAMSSQRAAAAAAASSIGDPAAGRADALHPGQSAAAAGGAPGSPLSGSNSQVKGSDADAGAGGGAGGSSSLPSVAPGSIQHRSKKQLVSLISPEHLIHIPRHFFQNNFNVPNILAKGLLVQVEANGVLQPEVVLATVANYQNNSGYSYYRLLGFKSICRQYISWRVDGWQKVNEETVRMFISGPHPPNPARPGKGRGGGALTGVKLAPGAVTLPVGSDQPGSSGAPQGRAPVLSPAAGASRLGQQLVPGAAEAEGAAVSRAPAEAGVYGGRSSGGEPAVGLQQNPVVKQELQQQQQQAQHRPPAVAALVLAASLPGGEQQPAGVMPQALWHQSSSASAASAAAPAAVPEQHLGAGAVASLAGSSYLLQQPQQMVAAVQALPVNLMQYCTPAMVLNDGQDAFNLARAVSSAADVSGSGGTTATPDGSHGDGSAGDGHRRSSATIAAGGSAAAPVPRPPQLRLQYTGAVTGDFVPGTTYTLYDVEQAVQTGVAAAAARFNVDVHTTQTVLSKSASRIRPDKGRVYIAKSFFQAHFADMVATLPALMDLRINAGGAFDDDTYETRVAPNTNHKTGKMELMVRVSPAIKRRYMGYFVVGWSKLGSNMLVMHLMPPSPELLQQNSAAAAAGAAAAAPAAESGQQRGSSAEVAGPQGVTSGGFGDGSLAMNDAPAAQKAGACGAAAAGGAARAGMPGMYGMQPAAGMQGDFAGALPVAAAAIAAAAESGAGSAGPGGMAGMLQLPAAAPQQLVMLPNGQLAYAMSAPAMVQQQQQQQLGGVQTPQSDAGAVMQLVQGPQGLMLVSAGPQSLQLQQQQAYAQAMGQMLLVQQQQQQQVFIQQQVLGAPGIPAGYSLQAVDQQLQQQQPSLQMYAHGVPQQSQRAGGDGGSTMAGQLSMSQQQVPAMQPATQPMFVGGDGSGMPMMAYMSMQQGGGGMAAAQQQQQLQLMLQLQQQQQLPHK